ncbi:stalk domain-containing protein [Paenibacillus sp. ATY16]|uniref:stalk domain-containing protein n=1 Tax=Paenibacillus sp. ATY16 TaxID=1759312 RepID=UPI00200E187C|nr:stalk domain-containing protein [Paenibacillus sp. ATY16]MCK9862111.1 copper amine oxidase N-terminal domain-containing protein [Paenibacillus sp. ATY16]
MKRKKILIIFVLLLTFTSTVNASSSLKQIKAYINTDLTIGLNEKVYISKPIVYNNSTYVPVRDVAKAFNSEVINDSKNNLISIQTKPERDEIPYKDAQITDYVALGKSLKVANNVSVLIKDMEHATYQGNENVARLTVQIKNDSQQEYYFKPYFYFELEDIKKEFDFNNQSPIVIGPESVKANQTVEYQFIYPKLPQSSIVRISLMLTRINDLTWVPLEPIKF